MIYAHASQNNPVQSASSVLPFRVELIKRLIIKLGRLPPKRHVELNIRSFDDGRVNTFRSYILLGCVYTFVCRGSKNSVPLSDRLMLDQFSVSFQRLHFRLQIMNMKNLSSITNEPISSFCNPKLLFCICLQLVISPIEKISMSFVRSTVTAIEYNRH